MPAMASFVFWPDFVHSAYASNGKVWAATDGAWASPPTQHDEFHTAYIDLSCH